MKVWLVKPDKADYDMYQGAVIVAKSKLEAQNIAEKSLTKSDWVRKYYGTDFDQVWLAKEIETEKESIILADFKAG